MLWVIVVALGPTFALSDTRVYEIADPTGGAPDLVGLYEETAERHNFQKLGDSDQTSYEYLFRHPENSTEWRIGNCRVENGETVSGCNEYFKASGGDGGPPPNGWTAIDNRNIKNTKGIKPKPWTVLQRPSLVLTLNKTKSNKGSASLDGGAICLDQNAAWVMLRGDDPKICDSNQDCKEAWDEICLGKAFKGTEAMTISGGDSRTRGVYNLTRNQDSIPLFYTRVDGWGYIRWWKGEDGNGEWLISGTTNGALGVVYRIRGNQTDLPLSNWRDVNGSLASDLLVTVVQHDHSNRKRCTLNVSTDNCYV